MFPKGRLFPLSSAHISFILNEEFVLYLILGSSPHPPSRNIATTTMSPSMYKYQPIDFATDAIRLVRLFKGYFTDPIRCELWETWLHQVEGVPYEALSYTWGGSWKSAEITLNERALRVTENLYSALQHLRFEDRDRILWVDAICIDQDNEKERGHQVGQMRSIYQNAEQVIIWLGSSSNEIDLLMDLANQTSSYDDPGFEEFGSYKRLLAHE
ncbi:hypothetical protein DL765_005307 [Monosporascus sp. GIB2]|nr:hypothetical protein DL765_005307 [Monosporascus sp. GIB2]